MKQKSSGVIPRAGEKSGILSPISRGKFLQYAGFSVAATGLVLVGCSDDDDGPGTVDLGSGDIGILNYAYLLEQLEAAFYENATANPYTDMSAAEKTVLEDIREHERAHRDFFKKALGTSAIAQATFDFSSIDFKSRASVLGAAKTFEDLGVSAYNGAGQLLKDANYLLAAGKIVSVEARHAAAIRDMLNAYSADFAGDDVVTASNGLDQAKDPSTVLAAAKPYVKTTVVITNLPS